MKIEKKIASLLSALLICASFPLSVAAYSYETPFSEFETPMLYESAGPNVEALEEIVNIDEFRAYIIEEFKSCPDYINISKFKIPDTDANYTFLKNYIWYETPELFQIVGLGRATSGGYITKIAASYSITASVYQARLPIFYEEAQKLLKGIKGNPRLSEVEKALLLHDRLIVSCEYDLARYQDGEMPRESYTAYGVFGNKLAVCMGYTLAYDYLLLQVGIDSYYCKSDVLNHAWNIVYIDGVKYHIDTTWDDPTWDTSGRVNHNNFLRSSAGMLETGHYQTDNYGNAVLDDNGDYIYDFDTSPNDTRYDSYYWQNSNAEFQLIGDDIYYIDNADTSLKRISNGTTVTCASVSAYWMASASGYWIGNFARLVFDGKNLLYSMPKGIYEYNLETGTSSLIYSPAIDSANYHSIYGFKLQNCKIICEANNSPNFSRSTKENYTFSQSYHVSSDWIVTAGSTATSTGTKQKQCINCGLVLETGIVPVISVTAKAGNTLDYSNCLVFTNRSLCSNALDLLSVSGSTTIAPASSGFLGTGSVIDVLNNGTKVSYITVIVNGDINGDSICDALDVFEVQRFSQGFGEPTENQIYGANNAVAESINDTSYQTTVNTALSA